MSTTSPDGAWRWNGAEWVPNSSGPADTDAGATTMAPPAQPPDGPALETWERDAAGWSHFGPLVAFVVGLLLAVTVVGSLIVIFAFVIPLIIRNNQGQRSTFVREHATASLNFQLTWLLAAAIMVLFSVFTFGLGLILVLAARVFMIVVTIKAGQAAKRGELYKYPLAISFF